VLGRHSPALSLQFDEGSLSRRLNLKVDITAVGAFTFGAQPGHFAGAGRELEARDLTPGGFFGAGVNVLANGVGDVVLLRAFHADGAGARLHLEELGRGHGAPDLLDPFIAGAVEVRVCLRDSSQVSRKN